MRSWPSRKASTTLRRLSCEGEAMDKPNDDDGCLQAVLTLVVLVLTFGAGCMRGCHEGHKQAERLFRDEAVSTGHAEHDSQTGEWKWK